MNNAGAGNGRYQAGMQGGGNGRSRRRTGCLSLLGTLLGILISIAVLLAVPVACTANMMDIHRSEEAARQEANKQKIEELRQEMQNSQQEEPAPYESGMQADGSWTHPHDNRVLQVADTAYHNLSASVSDAMPEVEFGLEPGFDGIYYLQTMDSDQQLCVRLYDDTGFCVASYVSEENGDGVFVELKADHMYRLKVERRFADTGNFQIRWWLQKQTEDITNYGAVRDSIDFNNQENCYLFRCSASKEYRFCFTEAAEELRLKIYIYDSNWNRITSAIDVTQGFGPYAELQAGQNYYIKVSAYGCGDYTLDVQQTG